MERQPEPEYMDLEAEAEAYAVADFAEVNAAFVARLMEVADTSEAWAADLGTGPGDIPLRAAQTRPGWRIVGTDASRAMLRYAQRAAAQVPALRWVECDAKALPLASAAFDVIFSNSILHHITAVDPFWQEVRRIARPDAHVFLRDLSRPENQDDAWAIVRRYSGEESDLLQEEFYRSLLSAYTPGEVRDQLARAGIAGLEVRQVTDRHLDIFGRIGA